MVLELKELEFGGRWVEPQIRMLHDMKEVINDRQWLSKSENIELYYMYRDLYLSHTDKEKLLEQELRYDITIMPPGMLGKEYIKTAGHFHPSAHGGLITYPELYEVLEGEAIYLLQKQDLSDVVAINAIEGDKVIVPPDYGHITINRSNKTLKMSNFVARNFNSIYEPFKKKGGGAYFYTNDGFIKNYCYSETADLRKVEVPDDSHLRRLGLSKGKEMYPLLREIGRLDYLVNPQNHIRVFEGLI
jgi:glucose-6-phosphate isomerase